MKWYYSKIYMNLRSISRHLHMQYLRFSQQCRWRLKFCEMWSCVIVPVFLSCLNDHSAFVFRAKQYKKTFFLDYSTVKVKTPQIPRHIWNYSPKDTVLHPTNLESFLIHVLGKTFCITKQTDRQLWSTMCLYHPIGKYLSTVNNFQLWFAWLWHCVVLQEHTTTSEWTLKMKAASSHKIFASTFQVT